MPSVARAGRARISLRRPSALGECDRCGEWWNRTSLSAQFQWAGNSLVDTGLIVCRNCLDKPQDQFRAPILPADPYPVVNPRVSYNITPIPIIGQPLPTSPENLGFTQYTLGAAMPGLWPTTQAAALAQMLALAGISEPSGVAAFTQMLSGNVSSWLIGPGTRTFLAIYNPTAVPVQLALASSATAGALNNLALGPGETYFWSTSQGLGTVWQGSVSAISQFGGLLPVWFWTDQADFYDDGGVLCALPSVTLFPTVEPVGAAQYWNNGGVVNVTSGGTAASAPLYFGSTTAAQLIGAGALPTTDPGTGQPLRLWNYGGEVRCAL